jgi:hypothetical protein
MGLPWVRLDTAFPRNHKLLALLGGRDGHRIGLVYVCGLAYAGEQGTDGFIPREALGLIHGRPADARRLVEVRLWVAEPGGWVINDWREYQMSTEETQLRSKKARAAALSRWHEKTGAPP